MENLTNESIRKSRQLRQRDYGEDTREDADEDYIFAGKQIARWEIAEGFSGDPSEEDLDKIARCDIVQGDYQYAMLVAECHGHEDADWDLIDQGIEQAVEEYRNDELTLLSI